MNKEEYVNLIKGRLSDYRFNHSVCVAEKAVELAKKYSTEDSSSFINGILAKVIVENGLK